MGKIRQKLMPEITGGKSYEETYKERNCQIGSTDGNYKDQT